MKERISKQIYPIRIRGDEFVVIIPGYQIKIELRGRNFTYSIAYLKPGQITED